MSKSTIRNTIIIAVILLVFVGAGAYVLLQSSSTQALVAAKLQQNWKKQKLK